MPRYLDKYRLQILPNVRYDDTKQNHTDQKFVLKRLKTNASLNSMQTTPLNLPLTEKLLFDKLTNQTLVLKILEHKSIPKCLRILKTTNSFYFVFQQHPFNSIQNYLSQNSITFQQKIQLSTQVISALLYIHSKYVIYKGICVKNLHVDSLGKNVYLTNFKEAVFFQGLSQRQKSLQTVKKQRQFSTLLKQDVLDLAKMLFEILQFGKIDSKSHSFANDMEKLIYDHLCHILGGSINSNSLQMLLKIMSEKQTIRTTACTESESPRLSQFSLGKVRKQQICTKKLIESDKKGNRNSSIGLKLPLKYPSSQFKINLIQSQQAFQKQIVPTLNSSNSRLSPLKRLTPSKISTQMTERVPIESTQTIQEIESPKGQKKAIFKECFQSIIKSRKLLKLILMLMNQIDMKSNAKLGRLLLLKCDQLWREIRENMQLVKDQAITITNKKDIKFLSIMYGQNLTFEKYLSIAKQQILQLILINERSVDGEQQLKSVRNGFHEESLNVEIYHFIEKEIAPLNKHTSLLISSSNNFKSNPLSNNFKISHQKQYYKTTSSQDVTSQQDNQPDYERLKWLYFMSIYLKYESLQNFYHRKISPISSQLDILKQPYFVKFQSQSIPMNQLLEQILIRLDKFSKNLSQQ